MAQIQKYEPKMTNDLMKCLEQNDRIALLELKSSVNFLSILESNEPLFLDLKRDWGLAKLAKPVMSLTESFLQSAYPDQLSMSPDITINLIEREPTWTLLDVVNFYKTIIQRQDLEEFRVMGNKITLIKLMEMVSAYEGIKAEQRESVYAKKKGELTKTTQRENSDQNIKSLIGREFEKIQIRDDSIKPFNSPANEQWFNKNPISE